MKTIRVVPWSTLSEVYIKDEAVSTDLLCTDLYSFKIRTTFQQVHTNSSTYNKYSIAIRIITFV